MVGVDWKSYTAPHAISLGENHLLTIYKDDSSLSFVMQKHEAQAQTCLIFGMGYTPNQHISASSCTQLTYMYTRENDSVLIHVQGMKSVSHPLYAPCSSFILSGVTLTRIISGGQIKDSY